jgi:acetyltransferase-like isoleucine patch superfamily enzyme
MAVCCLKNRAEGESGKMETMTAPKMAKRKRLTIHDNGYGWTEDSIGRIIFVRYLPSRIVRIDRVMLGTKIERGTNIFMRARLDCPGGVQIGEDAIVNQRCHLDGRGGLSIGNSVSIAADAT